MMVTNYSFKLILTSGLFLLATGLEPSGFLGRSAEANGSRPARGSDGLSFVATLAKPVVSKDEEITLKLSLTNNRKKPIVVVESNVLADYKIDVRDGHGTSVTPTPEGKDLLFRSQWGGRRLSVTIAPGESKTDLFQVNKIYAMTNPGSYTITASRRALTQVGKPWIELKSNEVKVTVVR